ncbi:hypothetical protein FACS189498_1480 [Spirochaetia bacterium]|nr:hypothetical protein FACS189498_1480 [Spirochaetia bacterium]
MRIILIFLVLAVCGFLGQPLFGLGDDLLHDAIEETEGRGLVIRSNPAGAKVFVDGIERGLTPLVIDFLPSGEYNISLAKDGYAERRVKVMLRSGSRLALSLALEEDKGRLVVFLRRSPESPPEDALPLTPRIFVDGTAFSGQQMDLVPGWRTVSVRAFGWDGADVPVEIKGGKTEQLDIVMKPAAFRLSNAAARRGRFNPANSGALGTTEITFEVSAPGQGRLEIADPEGHTVFSASLGPFETWSQSVLWPGQDAGGAVLPDGTYTIRITAETQTAELAVVIDRSLRIRPAYLSGGLPGLLFSPAPEILPLGSFQIEAGLLAGRPSPDAVPWKTLPFSAALRFSPLARLELAAALNVIPEFDSGAVWALGGSAKWVFLSGSPFGLALGAAWSNAGEGNPFGMNGGVELFIPVSWSIGAAINSPRAAINSPGAAINSPRAFSLVFSPAALWSGADGIPESIVPRLLLSGGFRFDLPGFSAGISLREDFGFTGDKTGPGIFSLGGELNFSSPPSNLIFSVSGGAWFKDDSVGGFGGLGIGLLF